MSFDYNPFGEIINWTVKDDNPVSFIILRNGTLVDSGVWSSGVPITHTFGNLISGIYNYTLQVNDFDGLIKASQRWITISITESVKTLDTIIKQIKTSSLTSGGLEISIDIVNGSILHNITLYYSINGDKWNIQFFTTGSAPDNFISTIREFNTGDLVVYEIFVFFDDQTFIRSSVISLKLSEILTEIQSTTEYSTESITENSTNAGEKFDTNERNPPSSSGFEIFSVIFLIISLSVWKKLRT